MKLSSNLGAAVVEIIIVVIVAGILVLPPLLITAKGTDDAIKLAVETAITDFANESAKTGKSTQEAYDSLIERINATGKVFDVELTAQILDENAAKKSSTSKGSNNYYTEFDTQIKESLPKKWKNGDLLTVTAVQKSSDWLKLFTSSGNVDKDKVVAQVTVMINY